MEGAVVFMLFLSIALIVYHYAVYPAAVILLSRLAPGPARHTQQNPPVSLIIAAYNEEGIIAQKILNSCELDYPELEIIVVADGSTDRTVDVARTASSRRCSVIYKAERAGKAAAVNRGVAAAHGSILVFSDANAMYTRNAISSLVAGFRDPRVGAVSGCKKVAPRNGEKGDAGFGKSEGIYWHYENALRRAESRLGSTVATVGEIFAVRRSIFEPFPKGVINDDSYLTLVVLRKGFDVRYEPEAISLELGSLHEADERARRRRIAAGRWQLISQMHMWPAKRPWVMTMLISHKWLRLAMPAVFFSALVSNIAAVMIHGLSSWSGAILFGQLLFYLLSLLGYGTGHGPLGPFGKLCRMCYFLVHANISCAKGFLDWLGGHANPLWQKAER